MPRRRSRNEGRAPGGLRKSPRARARPAIPTSVERITIGPAAATEELEDALFEILAEIPCAWVRGAGGELTIWAEPPDAGKVARALESAGQRVFERRGEEGRDWVAESAALRRPVATGPYLLDPHEGPAATPGGTRRRLFLPAVRAFGTGSHESTRLAIRLLLGEPLSGRRLLDVGCGTGTLAFVGALEGASLTVAFDLDPDAAVATRDQARANGLRSVLTFAGPVEALRSRFDVVVANMIVAELGPLLPRLRERLEPGGRLLTSGQLLSQQREWLEALSVAGFRPVRLASEGEWLGVAAERP